jgi:hypothetical protein
MRAIASCTVGEIELDDGVYDRVRWGAEPEDWGHGGTCADCGVQMGGIHHFGCDIERCPRCGDQLITCGCESPGSGDV